MKSMVYDTPAGCHAKKGPCSQPKASKRKRCLQLHGQNNEPERTTSMQCTVKIPFALTAILIIVSLGCSQKYLNSGTMLDERDGRQYATMQIGDQLILAENLQYETENSWCYNDVLKHCTQYGRLYGWETAMMACPEGWRLPSDAEWTLLSDHLGGQEAAGDAMKATSLWFERNTKAENTSGLSMLPGGYRLASGQFDDLTFYGYWWSSTELGPQAWYRGLFYRHDGIDRKNLSKDSALSVRCIKN